MDFFTKTKTIFMLVSGAFGMVATKFFGGADTCLKVLIFAMCADYLTGLIVAAAKKSLKTESGGLNSKVGFIGLAKKIFILLLVAVAFAMDKLLGMDFIRTYTVYAFVVNEILSLVENAGLIGVPIPMPILKAIDVLQERGANDV